jgi:hypothetical protein
VADEWSAFFNPSDNKINYLFLLFLKMEEFLDELTTCSVCMERYTSPKVLPCQPTFCVECITNCMAQLLWYEQVIIKFFCLLPF